MESTLTGVEMSLKMINLHSWAPELFSFPRSLIFFFSNKIGRSIRTQRKIGQASIEDEASKKQ